MALPKLPPFYNMKLVEDDNFMSNEALMFFDNAFQTLLSLVDFFNDGVVFPSKTTAEITAIEPNSDNGTVWFDTDLSKLVVKTSSGTIETISSS